VVNKPECSILDCENPATRILVLDMDYSEETEAEYCGEHEPAAKIIEKKELQLDLKERNAEERGMK